MRRLLPLLITALLLGACAPLPPAPGATAAEVQRGWGAPSARYAMPEGASRLEYASGSFGRTTWMVDLDANGHVTAARQVLNEAEFYRVQAAGDVPREALLRWIGTPGERRPGGWPGGEVWSWRYPTNDCLWFQASVSDAGVASGASYGTDPRCDAPNPRP